MMDNLKDAFNRFFSGGVEPEEAQECMVWILITVNILLILRYICREFAEFKRNQQETSQEIEIPKPVKIVRDPVEVFGVDCFHCGCGYHYTMEYVRNYSTKCPSCGSFNAHCYENVDVIKRPQNTDKDET